jgi:hypothetical protein
MKGFEFLVDSKTARISEDFSKRKSISLEEAIRRFLSSGTYKALKNSETGLYLEVFECVYDMFLEELGEVIE